MSDEEVSEVDKPEGAIDSENLVSAQEPPEEEVSDTEGEKGVTEVAREVLNGTWGEGQDRRKLLTDAGFDPHEVEAEVVRLRNE